MTYTIEQARKIYAMGLVPAHNAGFDPWEALEVIRIANAEAREKKAEANTKNIWVGKVVNDGKLGCIRAIEGNHVTLAGYFGTRSVHIGNLSEWSFRAA